MAHLSACVTMDMQELVLFVEVCKDNIWKKHAEHSMVTSFGWLDKLLFRTSKLTAFFSFTGKTKFTQ